MDLSDAPAALRAARERRGLSRDTVARRLDPPRHQSTIYKWETGVTQPEFRDLQGWARALGVGLDLLLTDAPVPELPPVQAHALAIAVRVIPTLTDDRATVLALMLEGLEGGQG